MDVNVKAVFKIMQWAIPAMERRGGGKIINIASTVGVKSCQFLSPYACSKHALVGLSHSVRDELIDLKSNVEVSVIYPGATDTPFNNPKEGQMDPIEIAEAIYFVATRRENCMIDIFIYPKMEKRKP
jgi:short-subunit dehydrogenase